jgi:hypothetical protein
MYISKLGPWFSTRRELVGHSDTGRVGSTTWGERKYWSLGISFITIAWWTNFCDQPPPLRCTNPSSLFTNVSHQTPLLPVVYNDSSAVLFFFWC